MFGTLVHRVETAEKAIALTFDDGPNPVNTPAVVELLEKNGAKGTFFVVGENVERHPELARRLVAGGHELGNHTYSHQRMVLKSPAFVRTELDRTDARLREAGARGELLFRSPYCKKLFVLPWILDETGRTNVTWDVDSGDTGSQDAGSMQARVLSRIRPGSIVLFHDGGSEKPATLATLRAVLERYSAEGWRFVTVSELLRLRS